MQRQKVEIAQIKEELRESNTSREFQDEDSFNVESCITANANLINENKG